MDNRGAVYVAAHADPLNDAEHNQVQRMAPGPGKPEILPFSGLANPTGVAVDKWGVVYLADYDSNQVLQLRGTTATANSGG